MKYIIRKKKPFEAIICTIYLQPTCFYRYISAFFSPRFLSVTLKIKEKYPLKENVWIFQLNTSIMHKKALVFSERPKLYKILA